MIRELQSDVTGKISLLVTKANNIALMLGKDIEDKKILDKDGNLTPEYSFVNDSKFINDKDIKWATAVKKQITDLHVKAFTSRKNEDITNLASLQQDTPVTHNVYFNDKWDGYMAEAREDVFMEAAFSRLLLIQSALRHDIIMSQIKTTTNSILAKIGNSKDKEGKSFLDSKKDSANDKNNISLLIQYKKMFVDTDWGEPTNNKTLYDSIIEYGGTTNPYFKNDSIEKKFLDKEEKTLEKYFTESLMSQILKDIKVIAVCKKASLSSYTAEKMAQIQGLIDDPRMLEKQQTQVQGMLDFLHKAAIIDVTSNPIKIFPTYKIYFIEEDAPEWGIYHDFYDYSAIQEITVVKDRESASDTCVIKLSNVTGKLTDTFAENMPEIGNQNMPLNSMMLKPGMSILVKIGYDNSQVTLPVVFYGIIVEVQPGPIVEIVCQGYGAELNEIIAPNEGVHHGVFGDVKGLGDVATWALQQSTGLNHFGKMGYAEIGMRDALRLSGTTTSGLQGKMKIASFLTGLPGINLNDPKDDNIYLPYNMGNISEKNITGTIDGLVQSFLNKFIISGNPTFDWYIRDQSIWDVIGETVYFSPDFIKTVLPYNDNIFPFIPKIRNTLYVGPKKGYYKYTDMYSIISKDDNVEIPDIGEINNLLFEVSKLLLLYNKFEGRNYRSHSDIFKNEKFKQLVNILNKDLFVRKIIFLFFNLSPESNLALETSRESGEMINLIDLVKKYLDRYTNFLSLDLKKSFNTSQYKDGEIDKLIIQGDFPSALKKNTYQDIGMNGIYYNRHGGNHQYKKVQQHHMITSHSNIINNNIQASANGWANRIKLMSPPDPGKYTNKNDVPINDREDLVTDIFNLDDDIYDDHIRPKEVFINNIDSSWFDDAIWAKKVLKGESSYTTVTGDKSVTDQNNPQRKLLDKEGGDEREKFENKNELDIKGETFKRNAWELLPSRWRVGISILAEEVRNMYNGEVIITGNSYIKPYDIIHLIDYVNDMHGSFEAGRVIHSFTPQTGFITRIKPDLIANQKDKFNEEEIFIGSQLMGEALVKGWADYGIGFIKNAAIGGAILNTAYAGATTLAPGAVTAIGTATGITMGVATGVGFVAIGGYLGYKGFKNYHERIVMTMNNIIGRDSIDIMPIMYRNLPYVAGIEGIKKNSYMRHMYGKVVDDSGRTSIFERIGYMNAPLEFEFYSKIVGNDKVWSFAKSILFPGLFSSQGSLFNQSLLGGNQ